MDLIFQTFFVKPLTDRRDPKREVELFLLLGLLAVIVVWTCSPP